jgi:hypothetical protein
MADKDKDKDKRVKTFAEFADELSDSLKREQIKRGQSASLQGMFKNLGKEAESFFSGPEGQARSRRADQAARDEQLRQYDNNALVEKNRAGGGSSVFNAVQDSVTAYEGVGKSKQLMDMARGPKAPSLGAAVPFGSAPTPTTPEGILKGNQLSAIASEPVDLAGVVDDVMATSREGKFQPAATPKADNFLEKKQPKFDPSELVTKNNQGDYVRDYNPQNLAAAERAFNMNQNKIANQARTDKRKDFASQLNAANYNPATASSEDKANFYAMGKDMGLSSDQIDSYANKQLDKQAERDYKRANMGKFLDTVDSQRSNRATTQGASGGLQRNRTGSNIRTSQADLDKEERRRNRS